MYWLWLKLILDLFQFKKVKESAKESFLTSKKKFLFQTEELRKTNQRVNETRKTTQLEKIRLF